MFRAAAVEDGDVFGAQQFGLGGGVYGGVAAADDDDAAAGFDGAFVFGLAQLGDEIDRVADAGQVFARHAEPVCAGEAEGEENGVVPGLQISQVQVFPEAFFVLQGDAADGEEEQNFAGGEVIGHFIRGDAVFVQAAGFWLGVVDRYVVALERERVGAGEAGGARADHGDAFAGGCCAGEGLGAGGHLPIGCDALQGADVHRFAGFGGAHTGAFAQDFGGADAGAAAAENIGFKNRFGRTGDVAGGDAADEVGDVDAGGAGFDARRVVAKIAAVGCNHRLRRG